MATLSSTSTLEPPTLTPVPPTSTIVPTPTPLLTLTPIPILNPGVAIRFWAKGDVYFFDVEDFGKAVVSNTWLTPPDAAADYEVLFTATQTVETCEYVPTGTFYRYRSDVEITITDLRTDKQIASQIFKGREPRSCPETIQGLSDRDGGEPNTMDAARWLADVVMTTELPNIQVPLMIIKEATNASFSPDGLSIVTPYSDGTVRILDVKTSEELIELMIDTDSFEARLAKYSPDGSNILTVNSDNTVRIWNASTGEQMLRFLHTNTVESASYDLNGRTILTFDSRYIKVWDVNTGAELLSIDPRVNSRFVSYSPDGQTIIASATSLTYVEAFDANTGAGPNLLFEHTDVIRSANYSPDGRTILTITGDDSARVWDASTGQELLQLIGPQGNKLTYASYSADGKTIITSQNSDNTIHIWDAMTGEELIQFSLVGLSRVWSVDVSLDGCNLVATGSVNATPGGSTIVTVWDISNLTTCS
jgi:WD40 repeat protein